MDTQTPDVEEEASLNATPLIFRPRAQRPGSVQYAVSQIPFPPILIQLLPMHTLRYRHA